MAKAKVAKAKVDVEAVTASLRRTRTRTRPQRTRILRQGGTLSPLVGNPTRDLRPVPRRKANKNRTFYSDFNTSCLLCLSCCLLLV